MLLFLPQWLRVNILTVCYSPSSAHLSLSPTPAMHQPLHALPFYTPFQPNNLYTLFSLFPSLPSRIAFPANSFLHDPRTLQTARSDRWWNFPTSARGILNALGICILLGGFLALFMGWPIHTCESFTSCLSLLSGCQ